MTKADDLLAKIVGVERRDLPPRMFRCAVCMDVGWLETDSAGRGTVRRCNGPHSQGCPHVAWRREQDIKRHRKEKSPDKTEFE